MINNKPLDNDDDINFQGKITLIKALIDKNKKQERSIIHFYTSQLKHIEIHFNNLFLHLKNSKRALIERINMLYKDQKKNITQKQTNISKINEIINNMSAIYNESNVNIKSQLQTERQLDIAINYLKECAGTNLRIQIFPVYIKPKQLQLNTSIIGEIKYTNEIVDDVDNKDIKWLNMSECLFESNDYLNDSVSSNFNEAPTSTKNVFNQNLLNDTGKNTSNTLTSGTGTGANVNTNTNINVNAIEDKITKLTTPIKPIINHHFPSTQLNHKKSYEIEEEENADNIITHYNRLNTCGNHNTSNIITIEKKKLFAGPKPPSHEKNKSSSIQHNKSKPNIQPISARNKIISRHERRDISIGGEKKSAVSSHRKLSEIYNKRSKAAYIETEIINMSNICKKKKIRNISMSGRNNNSPSLISKKISISKNTIPICSTLPTAENKEYKDKQSKKRACCLKRKVSLHGDNPKKVSNAIFLLPPPRSRIKSSNSYGNINTAN